MPLFETLGVLDDLVARDGPEQMALDEALLETAPGPVLRVYRWREPCVSFGYSQSLAAVRPASFGLPLVRRWTGGGIVRHVGDWTFALIVPFSEPLARSRPAETYRFIHASTVDALAALAIPSRLARSDEASSGLACFSGPALHDVVSPDGRKLCGGAERRTRRGFLHQGSIQGCTLAPGFGMVFGRTLARKVFPIFLSEGVEERMRWLAKERYGAASWLARIG